MGEVHNSTVLSHPKVGHISLKVAVQQNIATFYVTVYNGYNKVIGAGKIELELRLSQWQLFLTNQCPWQTVPPANWMLNFLFR